MDSALFGAGIALISSLALAIVGYLYQIHRDKEHRKWTIEDRDYQRNLNILNTRTKEAESYINQLFDVARKITVYETIIEDEKEINTKFVYDIMVQLVEITGNQSSIHTINDNQLTSLSQELMDLILEEYNSVKELHKKLRETTNFNKDEEARRIKRYFDKASNIRKEFIKRIDHLTKSHE